MPSSPFFAEQALAEAKKADEEIARGNYRGALHGVPVTIKDMFETAGVRTTGGSKILADWVPETDADLVERLRAAGAVIIGKTNLDEFGHGGTSTLSHFGPVHNPWDIERIAGGSSGGSAAAVAAGIGPLSYGTETGSSVRRPASYCGIVRLQTYLRYHQPARVVPRRLESRSCRALRAFSARYRAGAGRCRRLRRAGPGQRTPREYRLTHPGSTPA